MSKFDEGCFYGGYDDYAVSKEKHTKDQAIALAIENLNPCPSSDEEWTLAIGDCWVRHRAGINEDGEPQVGWWLEYTDYGRNCPAWCFHVARRDAEHFLERGYTHIRVISGATQAGKERGVINVCKNTLSAQLRTYALRA